ncbi:MAG: D-alanyl-D-alanine carboxypeptidase/D-alanyl-D-alanine-endopeptidase [Bacteroidota bacterium]|jgi:D-alanyl-D-alanine carboxypeptidase/D-alanyl-D-alanine-endopeptidase (penicillin-binding protein 4)
MRTIFLAAALSLLCSSICAQRSIDACAEALQQLQESEFMSHGIVSFSLRDANTGAIVFDSHGELSLPAASTQKIITALAAYEYLGKDFEYTTSFYANKTDSSLVVIGSYDPTLGSWRFANTDPNKILEKVIDASAQQKFRIGSICTNNLPLDYTGVNKAWIWEDIGNYYGAASEPVMWRENQFDVALKPGAKVDAATTIGRCMPGFLDKHVSFTNMVVTAKGNSDKTCTFLQNSTSLKTNYLMNGAVGLENPNYNIGVSIPGATYLNADMQNSLNFKKSKSVGYKVSAAGTPVYIHKSPTLDSITYWFLRKSINLYGEALIRTVGYKYNGIYSIESGNAAIAKLCEKAKVDANSLHLFDGCGLSPQNRVSANALSSLLHYARKQSYFNGFYAGLPIINDINMKSGSIHRVRAYAGYITGSDGNAYSFAIIANNYNCDDKQMQQALWKVLDKLK